MIEFLKRVGRSRAAKWFGVAFAGQFLPALLGWAQEAYEFFAAGPMSGEQFPGLSVLGYAAGAALTAALMGVLGAALDVIGRNRGDDG